jgi:hypothetical protein
MLSLSSGVVFFFLVECKVELRFKFLKKLFVNLNPDP